MHAYQYGRTGLTLMAYNQHQPRYPAKGAQFIVEVLTQTGSCQEHSLRSRLALGGDAVKAIGADFDQNYKELDMWKD